MISKDMLCALCHQNPCRCLETVVLATECIYGCVSVCRERHKQGIPKEKCPFGYAPTSIAPLFLGSGQTPPEIAAKETIARLNEHIAELEALASVEAALADQERIAELEAENETTNATFDLIDGAIRRATERWHDAGGDKNILPDTGDLVLWLLETLSDLEQSIKAAPCPYALSEEYEYKWFDCQNGKCDCWKRDALEKDDER